MLVSECQPPCCRVEHNPVATLGIGVARHVVCEMETIDVVWGDCGGNKRSSRTLAHQANLVLAYEISDPTLQNRSHGGIMLSRKPSVLPIVNIQDDDDEEWDDGYDSEEDDDLDYDDDDEYVDEYEEYEEEFGVDDDDRRPGRRPSEWA